MTFALLTKQVREAKAVVTLKFKFSAHCRNSLSIKKKEKKTFKQTDSIAISVVILLINFALSFLLNV